MCAAALLCVGGSSSAHASVSSLSAVSRGVVVGLVADMDLYDFTGLLMIAVGAALLVLALKWAGVAYMVLWAL